MKFSQIVILGGGFAGQLTAYSLAPYCESLIIIERDSLKEPRLRQGIPQAHHVHVLLKYGQNLLEELIPGLLTELNQNELRTIDWSYDTHWHGPCGLYPQYHSEIQTLSFSRKLLDFSMLQKIYNLNNLKIIRGNVETLNLSNGRINQVKYFDHNQTQHVIEGDLFIDTRGRNSNSSALLTQLGFLVYPPKIVTNEFGYASRIYQTTAQTPANFKQIYLQIRPGTNTKGVVIIPIEQKSVMITAIGWGQDKPLRNPTNFTNFLAQLPCPHILDLISSLKPESPIQIFRNLKNCHYRFGTMPHWPRGYIVIGDSACRINPVYGQGMTLIAAQVKLLKTSLTQLTPAASYNWEHKFQKKIDKITQLPWIMATTEDQRAIPRSERPIHLRYLHTYLDKIIALSYTKHQIHHLLLKILHMLKEPFHLFHPRIFFKIIFYSIFSRLIC